MHGETVKFTVYKTSTVGTVTH